MYKKSSCFKPRFTALLCAGLLGAVSSVFAAPAESATPAPLVL